MIPGIEKHTWQTVREKFKQIHPELYEIIDELSPSEKHTLYVAKYGFGKLILNRGIFQVVNAKGLLVPLIDHSIPQDIQDDLTYTGTMPMGMVTQNAIETFFYAPNREVASSSTLFTEKGMIALICALEGKKTYQAGPIWNVASGSRTICMLPKLTDKTSYNTLARKYQLEMAAPANLTEHWQIFEKIANHPQFGHPWHSELIFFSKHWFQSYNDKAWARFYKLLMQYVIEHTLFRRNQFIFDFAFSLAQENRNLKPDPYLADTLRHLIAIAFGEAVAMRPATDNSIAPVEGLQQVFVEDYGLKRYLPIIMHSCHFSLTDSTPAYYSLEIPTTTIFSPRANRATTRMADIRNLRHIARAFFSEIHKGKLMVEKTPLLNVANKIDYDFYHTGIDPYNEILPVKNIFERDPAFTKTLYNKDLLQLPEFSAFFNGCISISPKGSAK